MQYEQDRQRMNQSTSARRQAGEIRDANLMDYEEAEQIIADRIRWEEEGSEDD